jgi:hypothetical protein
MGSLTKVALAYVVSVIIGYFLSHAYTEYQFNKLNQEEELKAFYEKALPYKSQLADLESKLQSGPSSSQLCER